MTPSKSGRNTHPLYTRVAITGLLLYGLVTLFFAVLSMIDGEGSTVWVFVIFIVLSMIFAGLLWRFGKWALVVAALWGLVNLGLWGWLVILALSYPNSFFDFVLPLLLTVGALLAVVGATVAFVQQRCGTARTSATRTERRTFGAIAVVLLGACYSFGHSAYNGANHRIHRSRNRGDCGGNEEQLLGARPSGDTGRGNDAARG